MVSYSKEKTLEDLRTILENGIINNLYNEPIIKRYGSCNDNDKPYTEEIIKYLKDNNIIFDNSLVGIKGVKREKSSYYSKTHEILFKNISVGSNRDEENFVKSLFFYNPFEKEIGMPIDYQIPLKNSEEDKEDKIGKAFDLLTYKEDTNELYIVEVKGKGSKETALRCCLEVQTYYQVIDKDKLKDDYIKENKIKTNAIIKKAVIVFEDSISGNEFKAAESDDQNRKQLKDLVKDFDITVCYAR